MPGGPVGAVHYLLLQPHLLLPHKGGFRAQAGARADVVRGEAQGGANEEQEGQQEQVLPSDQDCQARKLWSDAVREKKCFFFHVNANIHIIADNWDIN